MAAALAPKMVSRNDRDLTSELLVVIPTVSPDLARIG